MRPFVSVITATALLLHLVLGCCAHHSHGAEHKHDNEHCAATSNNPSKTVRSSGCSHTHAHSYSKHESESHNSPTPTETPHEPCHEGSCVFLHTESGDLEQVWLPTLYFEALPPLYLHLGVCASSQQPLYSTPPPNPVRLTLLYRQLLI